MRTPYSPRPTGDAVVDRNLDALSRALDDLDTKARIVLGHVWSAAITLAAGTAVDADFSGAKDTHAIDDLIPGMALVASPPPTFPVGLQIVGQWVKSKGHAVVRIANGTGGALTIPAGTWAFAGFERA